jgi:hypothetical protein
MAAVDVFYRFQVEHIFADSLWNDPTIGQFLTDHGYTRNMAGNKMGMYSDPRMSRFVLKFDVAQASAR